MSNFDGLERSVISDCFVTLIISIFLLSFLLIQLPTPGITIVVQCYFRAEGTGPGLALCPASSRSAPPLQIGFVSSSVRKNSQSVFYLGGLKARGVLIIGTACRTWLGRVVLPEGVAGASDG